MFLPGTRVRPACVCCERWFHGEQCQAWCGRDEAFEAAAGALTGVGWHKGGWPSGASCCGLCGAFASSVRGAGAFRCAMYP